MVTQPQTLYGIADSPVGLAAWMINHDASSYSDIADAFAGHPVGNLTRDEVLDNVTFYWLTTRGFPPPGCTGRTPTTSSASKRQHPGRRERLP